MAQRKQIPRIVNALVKCANDGHNKVKNTVLDSLTEIGKHDANLVLQDCAEFMEKEVKAPRDHRISLLTVIQRVVQLKLDEVQTELANRLIKIALSDLTVDKSVIPEWQGKASSALVSLGMRFPQQVITSLLVEFGPGIVPHYFVMKTLGDLAIANPVGTVPMLQEVFSRTLPVLASIKQDNIRWVFASALGSFCEAIVSYTVNAAGAATTDVASFESPAFSAFELICTNWLPSKERKIRLVTIQSMGACCAVMAKSQLEAQLPKLVPIYNKMYGKEKPEDHLPITQGYCAILIVATKDPLAVVLEPLRDSILNTLFPLVCKPIDYGESSSLKNHNEMLRSIEILAKKWMDEVLSYLFQKLEHKDAAVRNGTLVVLKHLITRTQPQLEGKKELVVSALKALVDAERELSVKKSLAQVIISMANENYLCLYGGENLIEFIILSSSISDAEIQKWEESQDKKKDRTGGTSPSELRSMCDHILSLMTTTIPSMVDVLWPYLLEPLTQPRFTSSMAVVAKCIAHISQVKRQSNAPNYVINFDHTANVNLPKPQAIVARLFVLAHLPFRRGDLARHLLSTLLQLGRILHPAISPMWEQTIPKLLQYLDTLVSTSSVKNEADITKWETLVRRLLTETIKLVNDDMWAMVLGDAIIAQFPLYNGDPVAKKVALKMLGVVLQTINHKEYIKRNLQVLFENVDYSNDDERTGCAQGFGFASLSHLDIVLEQQTSQVKGMAPVQREEEKPKDSGGGLFSSIFGGSSSSSKKSSNSSAPTGPAAGKLNTIMLSYGYITAYAKPNYITSRLEIHIVTNMVSHLDTKDTTLQQTLIKSIDLIAQSVHPDHLQQPYTFKHRDTFLTHLLNYLCLPPQLAQKQAAAKKAQETAKQEKGKEKAKSESSEPAGSELTARDKRPSLETISLSATKIKVAVLALNACSTLVTLDPILPPGVEEELLNIIGQYFSTQKADDVEGDEINVDLILSNLERLYITLLTKDPTILCLKRLVNSFSKFFSSSDPVHRTRAVGVFVRLLKKFVDLSTTQKPKDRMIDGLGSLVGSMLPRCCDPVAEIRGQSIEAIQLLFYIDWMLHTIVEAGDKALPDIDLRPPQNLAPLTPLRKRMQQLEDQNEQFTLAHQMAAILAKIISIAELPRLILDSLVGLVDSQLTGARGACVVIYGLVSTRGPDLKGHVIPIVLGLIEKLQHIANEQTLNGTLHALRAIAKLHLQDTLDAILKQELPHKNHVTRVMQVLTRDAELVVPVVQILTDLLNNGDIMDDVADKPKPSGPKKDKDEKQPPEPPKFEQIPTFESQGATVCLGEMLMEEEMEDVVTKHFALIFGTLLLRIGTTVGHAVASEQTIQCWKHAFTALEEDDVLERLAELRTWEKISTLDGHIDAVTALTAAVAKRHVGEMRALFKFLQPFLKANYNGQRIVTAFTLAEFVNHAHGDPELLDQLLTHLLTSLVDPILKIPSLRGLGNIVTCPQEQINKYGPTVLDALMSSIDDRLDDVALESMNSLAKVFKVVDESRIAPVIINICHRIRPAFDNPNAKIRASSAALFGGLARFGDGIAKEPFYEQIHSNLPPIVLHMNDDSEDVQRAFRRALAAVGPLLHDEGLNSLLTTGHIFSQENDIDYLDFVNMHLAKAIIQAWPERLNSYIQTCINPYFNSEWEIIKGNAAYFIGSIMKHIPEDENFRKKVGINSGHTAKALIGLLAEKSPIVRQKTSEALCMLYSY